MLPKAYRWDAEMDEIAMFAGDDATAAIYRGAVSRGREPCLRRRYDRSDAHGVFRGATTAYGAATLRRVTHRGRRDSRTHNGKRAYRVNGARS
jgi:hypothetical protein